MTDFHYQPLFELGADDTPYRQLRVDGVTTVAVDGRELLKVDPDGPACHTGETSCFFNLLEGLPEEYEATETGPAILGELYAVIQDRQREMPQGSYTTKLLEEGVARIAQKVIEEAGEAAISGAINDTEGLPGEVADLLYHTLVLMAATGVKPQQVWDVLRERQG